MELYNEKKDKGFEIVSVNVLHPHDTQLEIQQFQQEFNANFSIVMNKTRADVAGMYKVNATPTNIVIDRNGNIVTRILGADMNKLMSGLRTAGLE